MAAAAAADADADADDGVRHEGWFSIKYSSVYLMSKNGMRERCQESVNSHLHFDWLQSIDF